MVNLNFQVDLTRLLGSFFMFAYSWNFTRIGRINDVNQETLKEILGNGDIDVTLSLERPQEEAQ